MRKSISRQLGLWSFWTASLLTAGAEVNVLTYHNDNGRTGANLNETVLTPANVKPDTFGKLFTYPVDGDIYAQPLYVSGLTIPGRGRHNVVFVATQHNSVYAFDADTNATPGGLLWHANLGPSAATPSPDFGNRYGSFTSILPEVGITGTPVIDLTSATLYVDAFTHEGQSYFHKLHALSIADGSERPFSPVVVNASVSGTGVGATNGVLSFEPKQELQRAALTLAGGIVYVAYGGYDDTDPFHGWIIGFNSANLQQPANYVFNTTPNSSTNQFGPNAGEGGIWMSGCGLSVDSAGDLYFADGNGSFNAFNNSGGTEYGDSFIRLSTRGGLAVADYFTPYNQQFLADNDIDVGSGGLALLPDQPGPYPHLMIGGGKQGKLYLINRDMMATANNHYNAGGSSDPVVQTLSVGGGVYDTPAYFNGAIYVAGAQDVLAAFSLNNGTFSTFPVSTGPRQFGYPGATPSISASGASNGIVWAINRGLPAVLAAYNANNLATEIYNSAQAGSRDTLTDAIKFALPTIANGKVYVGTHDGLSIFGLFSGQTPLPTPYDTWKAAHFGSNSTNPNIAGPSADPDDDGLSNLLEYAHATDPNQPDPNPGATCRTASNHFQIQFKQNLSATDLTYVAQATGTLPGQWTNLMTCAHAGPWTANTTGATATLSSPSGSPPDQYTTVTITDPIVLPAAPHQFLRVTVQQ